MFIAAMGICDEPPTSEEIIALAVQTVLYDPDNGDYAPVVEGLIKAYEHLKEVELEVKEYNPKRLTGTLAEQRYHDCYMSIRPDDECGWWPDALPYNGALPVFFIHAIARAIARRDIAEQHAIHAYVQREKEREARKEKRGNRAG